MRKILLLCVTSQGVVNFRASLIKSLQEKGYAVSVVAFDEEYKREILDLGIDFYSLQDQNRSVNPLKILSLKSRYKKIIKKVNPDKVFTFMLKPNVFGAKAAKAAGVQDVYSMVEGVGDAFIRNSTKWKLIRFVVCKLYKSAFKKVNKVFFLNPDDRKEFISRKLVKEEKCEIINGVGVDVEKFSFKPIKNYNVFLMVARMLETKGIYEYINAARIVKKKYPGAIFNYLGGEGTVKINDIKEYIDDGSINYLGTTKDVRPYLEDCSVLVLPSHREGMPMSIMEAEAVGRPIIASNRTGCKHTVFEGENGFLIDQSDCVALANKMIYLLENKEEIQRFGANSRKIAEEKFNQSVINKKIIEIIGR